MKQKQFYKQAFMYPDTKGINKRLSSAVLKRAAMMLLLVLSILPSQIYAQNYKAQGTVTCNETASISPNGTTTINGVAITSVSTGAVAQYVPAFVGCASLSANSLLVGKHATASDATHAPWTLTLTFDKPVNDLVLLLAGGGKVGTGYNEDFIFNGNNGSISTSSSQYCNASTVGNIVNIWSSGTQEGGGKFKVHSTRPFTQLVISGKGGANGSYLGICTESIVAVPPKCFISNANSTTGWKATVYDAPDGMNGWTQISASNSFPTVSYTQVATFDYNENANSNYAFDLFFATKLIGLTPANPQIENYIGTQIPYDSNEDYAVLFSKTIAADEEGTYQFDLGYGDDHIFFYKNGVKLKQQQNAYNATPLDNFATMAVVAGDVISILVVEEYEFNTEVQMVVTKLVVPPVQNITNSCPEITVNLNTAHTGTIPDNSTLVWFTNNTHTGTALSGTQITEAGEGTYYAFYYDTISSCYSPVSAEVTVSLTDCPVDHCITGCNNNTFLNTSDPNTLEYDNIISGYHGTIIKEINGGYKIWGQSAAADGVSNLLTPTEITSENGYNYTGDLLKAAMGTSGNTNGNAQFAILTTEGLYIWGHNNYLVSSGIKSDRNFGKIDGSNIIGANSYGLPTGVNPQDVKMMFGSYLTLAIVTCMGDAYVLSGSGNKNGDGSLDTAVSAKTSWHRVMRNASSPLTRVVALRGQASALMALTDLGEVYTWGTGTYLGDGTSNSNQIYATKMTIPSGFLPKMIGMTITKPNSNLANNTYYILGTNGYVYSLGANDRKQLGIFSGGANTDESTTWVQVKSENATTNMENIVWISPNEHDYWGFASIQALTAEGKMWSWGVTHQGTLGLNDDGVIGSSSTGHGHLKGINPRYMTGGLDHSFKILAVETGGHISTIFKDCDYRLGYVGHNQSGSYGLGATGSIGETNAEYKFDGPIFNNLCALPLPPAPEVEDLTICEGKTVDLESGVLNLPVPKDYVLEWWTTPTRVPGSKVANPETAGSGTYYAYFIGDAVDHCTDMEGVKVVVNENPAPVVPQDITNIKTFVNNDFEFTMNISGYDSYTWEYATAGSPTVWETLDNSTYNNLIVLSETTFKISHATLAINGMQIRLKAVSDKGCIRYSNEILIQVLNNGVITNPILLNQVRK